MVVFFNFYVLVVLPWWSRPKFSVEFSNSPPFCRQTRSIPFVQSLGESVEIPIAQSPGESVQIPTYWARLKVRNAGRSGARRCLCKLVAVMGPRGDVDNQFDPTQLHWVGTRWREVPFRIIDLDRSDYEYIDLLVTQENNQKIYICSDQFPWSANQQRGMPNALGPGKYILRVTVYGDNVAPKSLHLSLTWRGADIGDVQIKLHGRAQEAKSWLATHD